ncbi:MAG: SpoIIE family protein phosphatase, partial [bacterium]|nr:SpoIIE family protein phosphatase [bacterium]
MQSTIVAPGRLVIETGDQKGMVFPLRERVVSIGRGPDNTIQVIDTHMSRNHSLIIYNEGQWFVRDLKSKNQTLLNDRPISEDAPLNHGDRVQIGQTVFTYELESQGEQASDTVTGLKLFDDEGLIVPQKAMKLREENLGDERELIDLVTMAGDPGERILSVLYQVADTISSVLDLDDLLNRVVELVVKYFKPDRVGVLLYDDHYKILLPKAIRRGADPADEIVIPTSIIDRAIENQSAFLVADAPRDVRFSASDSIVIQRIRSAICVPLIYSSQMLGILYMDRRQTDGNYEDRDLKLVTIIANQAAQAIANSRLHAILLERRAQERELEIARGIQENLLPKAMPSPAGFTIHGLSRPAQMVGGDYYDVIPLPGGRYILAIADVSGKGIPAAILLASVRAAVQVEVRGLRQNSLVDVMDRLNQMVCRDTSNGMFVTMFLGLLDPERRTLVYCNAGHVHPLLCHSDGSVQMLEAGGCFLGIVPGTGSSSPRNIVTNMPLEVSRQTIWFRRS